MSQVQGIHVNQRSPSLVLAHCLQASTQICSGAQSHREKSQLGRAVVEEMLGFSVGNSHMDVLHTGPEMGMEESRSSGEA